MQHFLKDINPNMCHFRMTCTIILSYFWGFILDFRTMVPGLSKTSVLVLSLGLFNRSRSRTVGPLNIIRIPKSLFDFISAPKWRLDPVLCGREGFLIPLAAPSSPLSRRDPRVNPLWSGLVGWHWIRHIQMDRKGWICLITKVGYKRTLSNWFGYLSLYQFL